MSFFSRDCVKTSFYLSIRPIWHLFFEKITTPPLTFWHLTQINFSHSSWKIWRGRQTVFSRVQRNNKWKKREKLEPELFSSVSNIERQKVLAVWQNFSIEVDSTAFYLLIGRLWWRRRFFWKSYYTFLAFCFFGHWARTFGILSKTFCLVWQNCNLRNLNILLKTTFFEESQFGFFPFFVSVRDWTRPIGVSSIKSAGLSKLHSICPQQRFFENLKFRKKSVFISLGHRAKNIGNSHFFPQFCQDFSLLVQSNILIIDFDKLPNLLMTFWHLLEKKFSLLSLKIWRGSQNFISTCPQELLVVKKENFLSFFINVEDWVTIFWRFDKTFPAG